MLKTVQECFLKKNISCKSRKIFLTKIQINLDDLVILCMYLPQKFRKCVKKHEIDLHVS